MGLHRVDLQSFRPRDRYGTFLTGLSGDDELRLEFEKEAHRCDPVTERKGTRGSVRVRTGTGFKCHARRQIESIDASISA